jgi:hypothetical protein
MHAQRTYHPREPVGSELADDVGRAASNIGISRAFAYREIRDGRLLSFKVGARRLVSRDAQRSYVADREREALAQ